MKKTLINILLVGLLLTVGGFSLVQAEENQIIPQQQNNNSGAIEDLFKADTGVDLKQIGYDFFSNANIQGFGKHDGSYKLSIGEKVNVYSWGDSVDILSMSGSSMLAPTTKVQIDTKGNIFVPGIGIVKANGRSLSEVEKDLQSQASQKFTNIKVKLTVADSTEFVVFVYGYVNKPGKIVISNNSSVIEALAAAGGVNKNGTLRNIAYKSNGKIQKVDLYSSIFLGKDSDIRLQPNDTIYVNKIGSVVAVTNGVKIPGIYEVNIYDSMDSLINYAGGFSPSTNKNIVNVKTYKDGQRASSDIRSEAFAKTKLANGDILAFRNNFGKAENFVSLEGNVKHPAIFEYKKGMRFSDVLKNKNELQDETFIHQAVIKRVSGDGKQVNSIPVSLEDYFNGGNNPSLQPQDVITVYKSTNTAFVDVYGCIDKPKHFPYNDKLTLKDLLTDIQFIAYSNNNTSNAIHNVNTISNDNTIIPAYDVAVEITNKNDDTVKVFYLYDILIQNDTVKGIKINRDDKIFFRPLRDNEIIKTVKVSGYVKSPGVYSFVDGKQLSDMIQIAGGLSKDANLRGIVYKRASLAQKEKEAILDKNDKDIKQLQGQMASNATEEDLKTQQKALEEIKQESKDLLNNLSGRIALNIQSNDLSELQSSQNIEVQDGDEIYIPKFSNHVMVMGEVYNELSFVYKKGEKASYYIKLVGGFTPNARRTKIYKISTNGRAKRLNLLASNSIEPGDTIIIPRKISGNDWIQPLASTLQSIASVFVSIFVVTKL